MLAYPDNEPLVRSGCFLCQQYVVKKNSSGEFFFSYLILLYQFNNFLFWKGNIRMYQYYILFQRKFIGLMLHACLLFQPKMSFYLCSKEQFSLIKRGKKKITRKNSYVLGNV